MLGCVLRAREEDISPVAAAGMEDEGALAGVRFGMASAVLSAVVLVLSLRPLAKFRTALVASLLTIALVDSMADAYALFNAVGDLATAAASIAAKFTVCGVLAAMAYFGGRRPGAVAATQRGLYLVTAAFVAGQLLLTLFTGDAKHRGEQAAMLGGLFVAAVIISIGLNRIVSRLER
jgi:hypothetical protein